MNKPIKFCTNCGDRINIDDRFCGNCGIELKLFKLNNEREQKTKYVIDGNYPPILGNDNNRLYRKDLEGLKSYFNEMTNMERIFNEMTYSTRNGLTVERYLKDGNILGDPEVSNVVLKGFVDIKEFLEGMYSINKNDELNKDILSCQEAIQIIRNTHSSIISNDMDYDEEYFILDQNIMSIDSYKKEYPFLKEFREKLKTGEVFLEEMDSFIFNEYKDLDGDKIIYTISLFEQLEYILATHLNEWEKNNDNTYKGYEDVEQYHSLSQKTILLLRELLIHKATKIGKTENFNYEKLKSTQDNSINNYNKKGDDLFKDKTFIERIDFNSNNNSDKIIDSLKINPNLFNDFKNAFKEEQKYYEEVKVTKNPIYGYVSPLKILCENWFEEEVKKTSEKLLNDKEFINELTKSVEYIMKGFRDSLMTLNFRYLAINKDNQELKKIEKNIINVKLFQEIIFGEMYQNPKLTLELYDLMNKTSNNELYELNHNGKIIKKEIKSEDENLNPIQIKLKNIFYDKIPVLNKIGFIRHIK